jgi:hypothetical protein
VQPQRPTAPVVGERLPQPRPVAQRLDLLRRDPRLGQYLLRQQAGEPARIKPIGLRAAPSAEQTARLHRLGETNFETAQGELPPHPAPPGRRLDRHRHHPPPPPLRPAGKALAVGREAILHHLAGLGIEHGRLERVLVDIDRRVQHRPASSRRQRPDRPQRSGRSPYGIHATGRDPRILGAAGCAGRAPGGAPGRAEGSAAAGRECGRP